MEFKYNTVEEAIEAFKQGKMVLVTEMKTVKMKAI